MLFGAGAFDSIFGDVCSLPTFRMLFNAAAHCGREGVDFSDKDMLLYEAEEEEYCKKLAAGMLA